MVRTEWGRISWWRQGAYPSSPVNDLLTIEKKGRLSFLYPTWGRVWRVNDLSDDNFRVRVINVASSPYRDVSLDSIAVMVTYY